MNEASLNLNQHRRQLLEKAILKARNSDEAAKMLGVSDTTVRRMKKRFGIRWCWLEKKYLGLSETESKI